MRQSQEGSPWYLGMKAHIGVDPDSGLVHTVRGTSGGVNDVVEANALLHGEETEAWGDAGHPGADKRPDAADRVRWNIAMRPGKRRRLDKTRLVEQVAEQLECIKASVRAKVGHAFRVLKRQFGHVKVRYRGLSKNTAQLHTLFALSPPLDGTAPTDGRSGMSASANRRSARNQTKITQNAGDEKPESVQQIDSPALSHVKPICADVLWQIFSLSRQPRQPNLLSKAE